MDTLAAVDIVQVIGWITALVTVASVITAVTPTPKDDAVLSKFYKVIEAAGLVVGKAKDKGDGA